MHDSPNDLAQLPLVVDLMRNLSLQTDPQQAAALYGDGLRRLGLVPSDRYLSISRRYLNRPMYRITRCSTWKTHPDPWKERDKLPLFSEGLLGEILYSNEPVIIEDLPSRVSRSDPAYEYLHDMKLLVALPHFEAGEAINAGIILAKESAGFPFDRIPMMVWQANLWGRATLNLVNQQRLQVAYDAMDRELKVVADIQRSLLPRQLPSIPGVAVAAYYQTSQRAGGDYYDFFPLPGGLWGMLLADVSGHGTPAAVLMAITHAIAHSHPGAPMPAQELLAFVNQKLASLYTADNGNFVTAFYAIYDPATRSLDYASAGHPPPRLIREGKILCLDGESSLPLGILPREPFRSHMLRLEPGDRVLFYTDGITETFNPKGDAFGTERLDAACLAGPADPAGLLDFVLARVNGFEESFPVTDDRTLVAMRVS